MATQIVIATSPQILGEAGGVVSPPISAAQLKPQVAVKPLSEQILQVRVSARHGRDAILLANAIASDYARYVTQLPAAASGTPIQVFQPAKSATVPSKLHIPLVGAIGMGIGFLLGAFLAVIRATRDRRLRLRDEIASAIDIPVLASLEAKQYTTTAQWEKVLETYKPSPAVSWGLRRAVSRLSQMGEEDPNVRVLSLSGDGVALAAGPQLAIFAANLGIRTSLEPGEDHELVSLRAACSAHQRAGRLPDLYTCATSSPLGANARSGSWDDDPIPVPARPELSISIHTVKLDDLDPGDFAGARLLLAVSSGFATADDLARLALGAADAGHILAGIIVVNPDPKDNTTGALPDVSTTLRTRPRASHPLNVAAQTVEYR
jgi:hypothetical protein